MRKIYFNLLERSSYFKEPYGNILFIVSIAENEDSGGSSSLISEAGYPILLGEVP